MNFSTFVATALEDVRQRYAGLKLGFAWAALYPAVLIGIYFLIYAVVLKVQVPNISSYDYILMIASGLMPVIAFSEILGLAAASLELHRTTLLASQMPASLIPVRAVLAGQFTTGVGIIVCIVVSIALGRVSWHVVFAPLFWLMFLGFMTGLAWIVALATLRIRDIPILIGLSSTLLLVASPVMYTKDMIPDHLRVLFGLNPLSYFVRGIQSSIAFHQVPEPSIWLGAAISTAISLAVGWFFFQRFKHGFFDAL